MFSLAGQWRRWGSSITIHCTTVTAAGAIARRVNYCRGRENFLFIKSTWDETTRVDETGISTPSSNWRHSTIHTIHHVSSNTILNAVIIPIGNNPIRHDCSMVSSIGHHIGCGFPMRWTVLVYFYIRIKWRETTRRSRYKPLFGRRKNHSDVHVHTFVHCLISLHMKKHIWWGQTSYIAIPGQHCFELISSHQQGIRTACLAHHRFIYTGCTRTHVTCSSVILIPIHVGREERDH